MLGRKYRRRTRFLDQRVPFRAIGALPLPSMLFRTARLANISTFELGHMTVASGPSLGCLARLPTLPGGDVPDPRAASDSRLSSLLAGAADHDDWPDGDGDRHRMAGLRYRPLDDGDTRSRLPTGADWFGPVRPAVPPDPGKRMGRRPARPASRRPGGHHPRNDLCAHIVRRHVGRISSACRSCSEWPRCSALPALSPARRSAPWRPISSRASYCPTQSR